MLNTEKLEALGLEIYYEDEWVGEVGVDRRPIPQLDQVRCIQIPLTPAEWCELCMREGGSYIGGCCGQTGYIQDCFNALFRDSGSADAKALLELAATTGHHEGFELYQEDLDQEAFNKQVEKWDSLGPIDKIGLCYQAVKVKLRASWMEKPRVADREDDPIDTLYRTFSYFQYKDLFSRDENPHPSSPSQTGQDHGNMELTLARFVPAYRQIYDLLSKQDKPFEGFAVYSKSANTILKNGYGLCVYYTRKDAENLIELWTRSENKDEEKEVKPEDFVIKAVTVSMKDGLVVKGFGQA